MTERQKKILELIELKRSIFELKYHSNLNDKEIIRTINSLKSKGYNIEDRFSINYGHYLQLSKNTNNQIQLELNNQTTEFSVLAISDTHFISPYEDRKATDKIYDFASKKRIKYVFHLGDFVHGGDSNCGYTFNQKKFLQLLKTYPQDNQVTTFLILGNHDYYLLHKSMYNISNVIKNNILDIIPIGKSGNILVGNSGIELCHKTTSSKKVDNNIETSDTIILKGHQHIFKLENFLNKENRNGILITIPSVTNMIQEKGYEILQKGFVQLDFSMKHNKIDSSTIKQYMIEDFPVMIGEYHHKFQKVRKD